MNTRSETVNLTDTYSLIDIQGNGFDSALLFRGKAIALNWSDCGGSVYQYLARAGVTDYEESLRDLRYILDGNFNEDIPISSQIHSFLKLFVPGEYLLNYKQSYSEYDLIEFNSTWSPEKDSDGFYPFGDVLVFTQPSDLLNPDRVNHFVESIRNGRRPIALTATVPGGWCEFVLDGHHKLQAYKITQVLPTLISICRVDAPKTSSDTFDNYFGTQHPLSPHYREVKSKYEF